MAETPRDCAVRLAQHLRVSILAAAAGEVDADHGADVADLVTELVDAILEAARERVPTPYAQAVAALVPPARED